MRCLLISAMWLCAVPAWAHDTWVETNTNIIRAGDAVHVDLKLGNHGNDHRDFRLASKVDLAACTFEVINPDGRAYDLTHQAADLGYAPNEGYWTAKFVATHPGLYTVGHQFDKVMNHGRPIRSIRSGKTFFVVSPTLDRVKTDNPGFDRPLGHPFELVPVLNPVTPMGPGERIRVRLLFRGEPLADARVSFIPRGHALREDFDEDYERRTDADGLAEFTPRTGNVYLVVAHHRDPEESGDDYELTAYSATLTVYVPQLCGCCLD